MNEVAPGIAGKVKKHLYTWVGLVVVSLALVSSGSWLCYGVLHKNHSPFSKNLQAQLHFPLYYAPSPPAGIKFDPTSISLGKDVLIYNYTYDGGKPLAISIQPRTGIDVTSFNPTSTVSTHIGTAYIVDLSDRTTAAVVTEQAVLLINAADKMPVSQLTQFIDALRPAS